MTMLRKLFCNQTFLQATNALRTDRQRHRHSRGRIDTHISRLSLVLSPAGFSLSVGPQPVCVWAGGVLSVGTKCIRCALVCAVGQIWRVIITRRKLPRRCCENSIATKLFGKQPTRAGRMHTRIDTAQDGHTNAHLASVV